MKLCQHAEHLRDFARDDLVNAVERYRRCLLEDAMLGCATRYDEIAQGRRDYQSAIDEAQSECLLTGIRGGATPPP